MANSLNFDVLKTDYRWNKIRYFIKNKYNSKEQCQARHVLLINLLSEIAITRESAKTDAII